MQPTVGRIVHFYEKVLVRGERKWKGPYGAMVTEVYGDGSLCLTLFYPGEESHCWQVYPKPANLDESEMSFYWEWPPRV